MTKPEFTAGEWEADDWEAEDEDGFSAWTIWAGKVIVATVLGDSAEHEANAHLIAAAPDLYDALEDFVCQHGCKCGHTACRVCTDTVIANAALRKAGGAE